MPPIQTENGTRRELDEISREEIYGRLGDASLLVVDVLPQQAYASGHIPGAINLPLAELASRASELIPDRQAELAVYCASFT
jgi:ArsR family transcriptional regulator